jgi:hypothetical protein
MKELFYFWKWKLLLTIVFTIVGTLPFLLNWSKMDNYFLLFVYTLFPTSIWISATYGLKRQRQDVLPGLKEIDEAFKKSSIKSRYALKTIDTSKYKTITLENTGHKDEPGPKSDLGLSGPINIGLLDFIGNKVPVYYDEHTTNKNNATACWQCKNPDAFYTGIVFMNWETGEMTYPNGVIPEEPSHADQEMLPKFIICGYDNLTIDTKTKILNYLSKEYMRRNRNWLKNNKNEQNNI